VQPGETYTLSAYMKADRSGVPARLVMRFGGDVLRHSGEANTNVEKIVTLTKDWARYAFTLKAKDASVCVGIGPDLRGQPDLAATVWIDAIQFERNEEASAYAPRGAVEAAVETGRLGNVFTPNEPVSIRLAAVNQSPSAAKLDVIIALRDYFDAPLPETHSSLNVPAGGRATEMIPVKVPGLGFYRLSATITSNDLKQETSFPLAVIYEYDRADAPFGVNHAPANVELLKQFHRAGIFWGRNWATDWNEVEPRQNSFEWGQSDQHIARLQNEGWQVLTLLPGFSSAKWASELPPDFVVPPTWRGNREWAWLSAAPKDPANLANYIRKVVSRYKGRVNHWEFLNEPGTSTALPSPYRGMPGYRYDAQSYVDLLKVAAKALKETDPSAKLVGGYGLEVLFRAPQFIRAGGLDLIDIYGIHPYGFFEEQPEQFIPQLEELLSLMDASPSGRKPIWVTESAYYGQDDKPWLPWVSPPGAIPIESEKTAADHSIRHALIMLSHGVDKIFYHSGISGEVNNGSGDLGNCFLGPLGVPKKLYAAQAYLAHLLGSDFQYVGPMAKPAQLNGVTTDNVYGYAFQCGRQAVLAAWAPTEWQQGRGWTLKVPRDVDAFNIVGMRLTEGGNAKFVVLGDSPVYLVTELMPARDLVRAQMLRVSTQEKDEASAPVATF
jgi:hypothetical protein